MFLLPGKMNKSENQYNLGFFFFFFLVTQSDGKEEGVDFTRTKVTYLDAPEAFQMCKNHQQHSLVKSQISFVTQSKETRTRHLILE